MMLCVQTSSRNPIPRILHTISPGLVLAATGVGAGDIVTGALAGAFVGPSTLWVPFAGVLMKWYLTEGLTRWQLSTKTTLLEGWNQHLGRWVHVFFGPYLILWALMVGAAVISACGVAGHLAWPLGDDPFRSKVIWGVGHSLVGLALVRWGGYGLLSRLMSALVALMFAGIIVTGWMLKPDLGPLLQGLLSPDLPRSYSHILLGILGGVGGTLTLLSYGYWIRAHRRETMSALRESRIDLGVSYFLTALFSASMIIIGSQLPDFGRTGTDLPFELAHKLASIFGPLGRWAFIGCFWGAVFSSLLGVWQGLPYLFADYVHLVRGRKAEVDYAQTRSYTIFQLILATLPTVGLFYAFERVQFAFALTGACFVPFLAVTLLRLNNSRHLPEAHRNSWLTNAVLVATLAAFAVMGYMEIAS
jgi:Mn2+/Fe2+ NRAMP family transporter